MLFRSRERERERERHIQKNKHTHTHIQDHTPRRERDMFDDCRYPTNLNPHRKNACGTQRHAELSILQTPGAFGEPEQTLYTSTPAARDRGREMERVIITGERLMMSGILGGEKRIGGVNDLIDFEDWAGQSETSSVRCELPVQLNREHMHQLRCAPLTPLLTDTASLCHIKQCHLFPSKSSKLTKRPRENLSRSQESA